MTAPCDLRVEDTLATVGRADRFVPVAGERHPRLSWTLPLVRRGQAQSAWQVIASELGTDPSTDPDPVWDSGPVDGPETLHRRWGAEPLDAHRALTWRVRSIDECGAAGAWSEPTSLETGPFELADWGARWVEAPAGHRVDTVIALPLDAVRARLHLTAQGLVRAAVDGIPVNPDACDPTRTDPSVALVRTYDVTDLLTAGPHTWQLTLARGQQVPRGEAPRVLAELVATLADGSTVRSGTGHDSRHTASSMIVEEAFYLEGRDARIDAVVATAAGTAASASPTGDPVVVPGVGDRPLPTDVRPDPSPPLRVVRRVTATLLGSPEPGVQVFDVGENVAGRSRVEVQGAPSGSKVTVVHGETMLGGRVSTLNIRLPHDRERERQVVSLVCTGGIDVVEPWFAVHGFRYVEVRDIPAGASVSVSAGVLHTDAPQTGTFACDDPLVERLVDMARRTQLNNLHGLPEDCPTREQSGWTGDAAASAAASSMHLDLGGTYRKWLGDLVVDQRDDGAVPGVSPAMGDRQQPPDPVWGAAYPVVLEQNWLHTGAESLVREHLPSLGLWCDYQLTLMDDGLVRRPEISYGHDWLAPEQTPPVLMQTCAAIACLLATARLEQACGDAAVAARRRQQAQHSVDAARARLRDPVTGHWANGSQGSWALAATLLLDGNVEAQRRAVAAVAASVASGGNRLSSGFATTRAVVAALAEWNHGSGVLACLRQPVQPGVGSMLVDGPGTFWETWWIDTENVGVASLDHIGLAAPFAEWAWTRLAGLRPTGPGWATFDVAPSPTAGIEMVNAVVTTPRGRVVAAWRRDGHDLTVEIEVPVGSNARIALPHRGMPVWADGVDLTTDDAAHPHLRSGSGIHPIGLFVVTAPPGCYQLRVEGVGALPGPAVAMGAAADVEPGGSTMLALAGPTGGAHGRVDAPGWTATIIGSRLQVTAPPDARVGDTATVSVGESAGTVRVGRSGRWLGDGARDERWQAADGARSILDLPGGVVCEPVFHEPLPGPVLVVLGEAAEDVAEPLAAQLDLRDAAGSPLDLREARTVFASVDFCVPGWAGRRPQPTLTLESADGSTRSTSISPLPVGWNRLAVDVGGWSGSGELVGLTVSCRWVGEVDDLVVAPLGETVPDPAFRIGRVGWSTAPLTW